MEITKWDKRFLELAEFVSTWSKDPSTKCGAVVVKVNRVLSMGFNGFPSGIADGGDDYLNRTLKYEKILHAEDNALLFAHRSLIGCTIYTYPFPPCSRCAAKIIQSGIIVVIAPRPTPELLDRWHDSLEIANEMYLEAGVKLIYFSEDSK